MALSPAARPAGSRRQPTGLAWALWALTMLGLPVIAWLDHLSRQAGRPELAQLSVGGVPPELAALSAREVPEVDRGRHQQVPPDEGRRSVVACLPSSAEVSCDLVVRLPGAAPQLRAGPALLPLGRGQGSRDSGVAPRACGAAPPASTAPPAANGPCAARGAQPGAPTGALVGVSGAARDAAALAPAHGPPTLDLPGRPQGTASAPRRHPAAHRPACPREPQVGLPADPGRAVTPWRSGVGQLDPAGAARSPS
jgi:hypothetical protein